MPLLSEEKRIQFFKNGFAHLQGILPQQLCSQLKNSFVKEVKPFEGSLLRQRTVLQEPHSFNSNGYVENALLDVHRNDLFHFDEFTNSCIKLFAHEKIKQNIQSILGDQNILVQSMYFESSKGTPEHFDQFFLGLDKDHPILGVWIALEDICEKDGRFYVYPESHDLGFKNKSNADELRQLFQNYTISMKETVSGHQSGAKSSQFSSVVESKRTLRKLIRKAGWQKHYPAMKAGDVILFCGDLLHGSDQPNFDHTSRHSLTGHFVTAKQPMIRYGDIFESINLNHINGLAIHNSKRYTFTKKTLNNFDKSIA